MKRALLAAAILWSIMAPADVVAGAGASGPAAHQEALDRVLAGLDRIAGLYRDEALRFSCEEKIIHSRPSSPSRFFKFEYVYEFSGRSGLLDFRVDSRTPHHAGKAPPPARLSEHDLPYFVTRGYSFIFLFDRAHQSRHLYALGAATTVMGRPALAVRFEPVPPVESDVNDWFGTLWVDRESLQPLRVEAIKQAERDQEQAFRAALASTGPLERPAKDGWIFARVEMEFTQEKNGMRFPGRIVTTGMQGKVRIRRGRRVADERTLFTVTQLYTDYRFFGVKTREAIREIGADE
jgi:hypothetical protein